MRYLGYDITGNGQPYTILKPDTGKAATALGKAWSLQGAKRMIHKALGLDRCPECGRIAGNHVEGPAGFVQQSDAFARQHGYTGPPPPCTMTRSQASTAMQARRDALAAQVGC